MQTVNYSIQPYVLDFTFPAGTSRGTLLHRKTFFVSISSGEKKGIGEAAPLKGLSIEYQTEDNLLLLENKLTELAQFISYKGIPDTKEGIYPFLHSLELKNYPSAFFALEMALFDFFSEENHQFFSTPFTTEEKGVPINGLVWMGTKEFMHQQIEAKLTSGFTCIKMKIGAIDFEDEFTLLQSIRDRFPADKLTLRVDANGAFNESNVNQILERLASLDIHSIEQPIAVNQPELMHKLCSSSPIPIALDEELIGIRPIEEKRTLLETIRPPYIILKPSLLGGFQQTDEWITLAEELDIGWWMTSALESNIGLNAIAQYASSKKTTIPQGLGTGKLYHNNIESPLEVSNGFIYYRKGRGWSL
ncbi:MAG: o-succinylbenzoate synthase [Cyclobacteriaceae bacterium]